MTKKSLNYTIGGKKEMHEKAFQWRMISRAETNNWVFSTIIWESFVK